MTSINKSPSAPAPKHTAAARQPASPSTPASQPSRQVRDTSAQSRFEPQQTRSFAALSTPARSGGPPPLEGRTAESWQQYAEQFRGRAEGELATKRSLPVPDPKVSALLKGGGGPVYVGAWSTTPGKENTPVFFQNFPSDQNVQAQLYSYPNKGGQWVTFEIAGNFQKAYSDPGYTSGRLGTSSALGFPESGTEFADAHRQGLGFQWDAEVSARIAQNGSVPFQKFENGYLVDLGGGKVQAFDLAGQRVGSSYPGGKLSGSASTPTGPVSGINPKPELAAAYQPYEVVPGVSVPSRVGVHWGPATAYDNVERINQAADMLKQAGVGFVTVIVNPDNPQGQRASIQALKERGIEPLVRLLPAGSYGEVTMDKLDEGQMRQMAEAARQLKDMGVKIVQLDNEPNWGNKELFALANDPARTGEFKAAMGRYAANTARVMDLINQQAPGMAIGFGALAATPEQPGWEKFHDELMWNMKGQNDARGGQLLQNAFLAVHPYTIGQYNPNDKAKSAGVEQAEWMKQNARDILGVNINTLASEGGNPQDKPHQAQASSDINTHELAQIAKTPGATTAYWLIGHEFLSGAENSTVLDGDPSNDGLWEHNSLIWVRNGRAEPNLTFRNLVNAAQGRELERG
jgi:hypothetical protein